MTNKEWLDYLAQNAPDELAAWFDAEHVEHQERALDGDTDALERKSADLIHEYYKPMVAELQAKVDRLTAERDTLQGALDIAVQNESKLEAERDEWKSRWETGKAQFDAILAERELYREALSQLLDTVTDGMGKVSALLDSYDEGMA